MPQKAQLFAGTIRSNLLFAVPDAGEEDIEEALSVSQAKEFVDAKEGGWMLPWNRAAEICPAGRSRG